MVCTMEMETGKCKSAEVVFEHPAIDRTPNSSVPYNSCKKKAFGPTVAWMMYGPCHKLSNLSCFPLSSLLESHFRTLSPILKSEALVFCQTTSLCSPKLSQLCCKPLPLFAGDELYGLFSSQCCFLLTGSPEQV